MCGRAYETYSDEELSFQYLNRRPLTLDGFAPTYNLTPEQRSPVVLVRDGERTVELFRWGLIPAWAKSIEAASRYSLINARAEGIAEKRSYAQAFRRRRCIVPLSGFYEWKRDGKVKRPFVIRRRDGKILSVAGVWESWKPADDSAPIHSFAIVTIAANDVLAGIHDRMPVILSDDDVSQWMNPDEQDPAQLQPLLKPCPSEWLETYEVSRAVNSPANNSPDVLIPLDAG